MKVKVTLITLVILMVLFTGCSKKDDNTTPTTTPAPTTTATKAPTTAPTTAATTAPTTAAQTTPTVGAGGTDVVTTASIVDTEAAFLKAISKDGTWIIAITKDLTTDKELLLTGEFKNGKKDDAGKDIIQRKVALYSQDENRTITARYTLTAPKFIVFSPMASIQHGTFKGDVYVSVNDFQLVDATIDGNVYFTTEEAKSTFKMDDTSKITGKQEIKK